MQASTEFAQGETLRLGRIHMTPAAVEAFAGAYDPQLQHLDDVAARQTPLQGQAASGWHTCTLLMHQVKRQLANRGLHVEVPAIDDIRWLRPVRPNDVLEATIQWRSRCTMPECATSGGWMVTIEAVNQDGEPVVRLNANALVANEPSAIAIVRARAPGCAKRMKRPPRALRRPGGHLVRYFEDVELGDEIALGTFDFSEAELRAYAAIVAGATEPVASPAHAPANATMPRVDSWHVVAAWMRRIVDYYHSECEWLERRKEPVPLLGPAVGARCLSWCGSVQPGDVITFCSWAEHRVNFGTSSEWGLLVAGVEGVNRDGKAVLSFYPQFLLQKRPT